jgi:hypothetical protein
VVEEKIRGMPGMVRGITGMIHRRNGPRVLREARRWNANRAQPKASGSATANFHGHPSSSGFCVVLHEAGGQHLGAYRIDSQPAALNRDIPGVSNNAFTAASSR